MADDKEKKEVGEKRTVIKKEQIERALKKDDDTPPKGHKGKHRKD